MKKFVIIFILLIAGVCFAGQKVLEFTWNQVIPDDMGGWYLYQSQTSGVYELPPVVTIPYDPDVTNHTTTTSLTSPDNEKHTYYFILRAFDTSGNVTPGDNETSLEIDFEPPPDPTDFTVRIITE